MSIAMEQVSQRFWCKRESIGGHHDVGNRLYPLGEGRGFDESLLSKEKEQEKKKLRPYIVPANVIQM